MVRTLIAFVLAVTAAVGASPARPSGMPSEAQVDRIFGRWTGATPGCAVGVGVKGRAVLETAYGLADLEHGVPNRPDTIFEAGSVSKQFTAAAVLLLARDGKLSLDDPARKYVPELPDYGTPLTIRHMLQHTSGLRDWGSIAELAGWPRTTRVHTHAHVLDIVKRQRALNFTPGTRYSYSNTGYNLAAIIVSRVSGESFADFTRKRIFAPLGMTRTSWRDDYTRVVKDRAIAYRESRGEFRQHMPFENVHGNGGLLTTVGDLLRWSENPTLRKVGDGEFLKIQHERGRFNDGTPHPYALGLVMGEYRGIRNVSHSGSTAGYRAHLLRFPDEHVSIAVLCNVSSAAATEAAEAVADLYLAKHITMEAADVRQSESRAAAVNPEVPAIAPERLAAYTGRYASDEAEAVFRITVEGGGLMLERRPDIRISLTPVAVDAFEAPLGRVTFLRDRSGRVDALTVRMPRVFDIRFTRE